MTEKIMLILILIFTLLETVVIALTKLFSSTWTQTFQQSHFVAACGLGLLCNLIFLILLALQKWTEVDLGPFLKYEGFFAMAIALIAFLIFAINGFRW